MNEIFFFLVQEKIFARILLRKKKNYWNPSTFTLILLRNASDWFAKGEILFYFERRGEIIC